MTGLKLHLGCGPKHIPGFFHIDALDGDHVDHVGPVDRLDTFEDESVSLIYASHLLEHFGRREYMDVLREWYRVIEPGGVLRLGVPDFAACAKLYTEGKLDSIEQIRGLICGGQKDEYDYHKMIFDRQSLHDALIEVGFSSTRLWDWRDTEHADLDDFTQAYIPHMAKDTGTLMSLNLEAVK
ncbi:MAG: methyltransferase domain-containing protein [Parasphingopyxis sp.]|uniref:class I SAM-dependent methyltransferase n=1 Tax=Parasphingopyxis sp. TaxID=1920299 RepID=UPI002610DDF5|nr:methyltransferase domain-containing protein [uncultured Parasphingopyxis sp.]